LPKKKSKNVKTILGTCLGCGSSIMQGQKTQKHNGRLYHAKCAPKE